VTPEEIRQGTSGGLYKTPTSRAAEIAKRLASVIASLLNVEPFQSWMEKNYEAVVTEIADALQQYAEEQAKEALSDEIRTGAQLMMQMSEEMRKVKAKEAIDEIKNKAHAEGYAKGIEDAARIVDRQNSGEELCAEGVAERIRALGEKEGTEK
jgi:hypothetical protein